MSSSPASWLWRIKTSLRVPATLSRAADVDVLLGFPGRPVAKPVADGLQCVNQLGHDDETLLTINECPYAAQEPKPKRMGCCASMRAATSVAARAIVARTKGMRIDGLLPMSEIVGLR